MHITPDIYHFEYSSFKLNCSEKLAETFNRGKGRVEIQNCLIKQNWVQSHSAHIIFFGHTAKCSKLK